MGCWKVIAGDFAVHVIGVHAGQVARVVNRDGTVSRVVLGKKVGKHLYRSVVLQSRGDAPPQSGKFLVKDGKPTCPEGAELLSGCARSGRIMCGAMTS